MKKYKPELTDKIRVEVKLFDGDQDFERASYIDCESVKDVKKIANDLIDNLDLKDIYWDLNMICFVTIHWNLDPKDKWGDEWLDDYELDFQIGNDKDWVKTHAQKIQNIVSAMVKGNKFEVSRWYNIPDEVFESGEINEAKFIQWCKGKKLPKKTESEIVLGILQSKFTELSDTYSVVEDDQANNIYSALTHFFRWLVQEQPGLIQKYKKATKEKNK